MCIVPGELGVWISRLYLTGMLESQRYTNDRHEKEGRRKDAGKGEKRDKWKHRCVPVASWLVSSIFRVAACLHSKMSGSNQLFSVASLSKEKQTKKLSKEKMQGKKQNSEGWMARGGGRKKVTRWIGDNLATKSMHNSISLVCVVSTR